MFFLKDNLIMKFHKDFYVSVKRRVKTSTCRLSDKGLEVDDIFLIHFVDSEYEDLLARIVCVSMVPFHNLGYDEAYKEGYLHQSLLQHELKSIYPDIVRDTMIYVYEFDLV